MQRGKLDIQIKQAESVAAIHNACGDMGQSSHLRSCIQNMRGKLPQLQSNVNILTREHAICK